MAPPKRTPVTEQDTAALAEGVLAGNRRILAQAITLIESTRGDHRAAAADLLERLMPSAGNSIRLGISGVPGVGKSTLLHCMAGLGSVTEGEVRIGDFADRPPGGNGTGNLRRRAFHENDAAEREP